MKFDDDKTVLEVLVEARARISSRWHWTRGVMYRKRFGLIPQWCALGSLRESCPYVRTETAARNLLDEVVRTVFRGKFVGPNVNLMAVNDNLGHRFVLHCFDLAIAQAREDEAEERRGEMPAQQPVAVHKREEAACA